MTKPITIGFPVDMDELELALRFGLSGIMLLLTIARDQTTRKSKGLSFILMDNAGALSAIAALQGHAFGYRLSDVRIAKDQKSPLRKQSFKPKSEFGPGNLRRIRIAKGISVPALATLPGVGAAMIEAMDQGVFDFPMYGLNGQLKVGFHRILLYRIPETK